MDNLRAILDAATPGSWKTHLVDDTTIVSDAGVEVATTCDSSNTQRADAYNVEYERMEADARLIAMAPDLAAEVLRLREALRWIADRDNCTLLNEQLDRPTRLHVESAHDMNACARAALAERKGE